VNVRSGCYGDSGGQDAAAYTMSLWDFAVKAGRFSTWQEARKAFAEAKKIGFTTRQLSAGDRRLVKDLETALGQ
jgi:hypothetical protein